MEQPWYAIEELNTIDGVCRWRILDDDYTFDDEQTAKEWFKDLLDDPGAIRHPIRIVRLTPEVLAVYEPKIKTKGR